MGATSQGCQTVDGGPEIGLEALKLEQEALDCAN